MYKRSAAPHPKEYEHQTLPHFVEGLGKRFAYPVSDVIAAALPNRTDRDPAALAADAAPGSLAGDDRTGN
jgi:hypothetical protein